MDRHDAAPPRTGAASPAGLLPEVEAYAHLLVVLFLVDHKLYAQVRSAGPAAQAPHAACLPGIMQTHVAACADCCSQSMCIVAAVQMMQWRRRRLELPFDSERDLNRASTSLW